MSIRIVKADLTWLRRFVFSMVTRDAVHGRSNTIHRITRFGRTGARFSAGAMEHWRRGLRSFAAASLAGAHL